MSIFFRGLIDKLGIHGLSYGYTDGFEEKSLSIIRKTARVSQRVYLYIYIYHVQRRINDSDGNGNTVLPE